MKRNQVKKYNFQKIEGTEDLSFCFQAGFLEGSETV